MTADDELLISIYSDGLPEPARRAREALPNRSPKGLGVRVSVLRERGLIKRRERAPKAEHVIRTSVGSAYRRGIAVEVVPIERGRPETESPVRCPHCLRVFFASDSLPIRSETQT